MSHANKSKLPIGAETVILILLMLNGAWMIAVLLGYDLPFINIRGVVISAWISAIGTIYLALRMIMIKIEHHTLRTLL